VLQRHLATAEQGYAKLLRHSGVDSQT
jgi:hypothetical protein